MLGPTPDNFAGRAVPCSRRQPIVYGHRGAAADLEILGDRDLLDLLLARTSFG